MRRSLQAVERLAWAVTKARRDEYDFSEGRTQVFTMGSVGLLNSSSTHSYPSGGTVTSSDRMTATSHGAAAQE